MIRQSLGLARMEVVHPGDQTSLLDFEFRTVAASRINEDVPCKKT